MISEQRGIYAHGSPAERSPLINGALAVWEHFVNTASEIEILGQLGS